MLKDFVILYIEPSILGWYVAHAVLFAWFSVFIAPLKHADRGNVTYFWTVSFATLLLLISSICHAPRLFHYHSTRLVDIVAFAWAVFPICAFCLDISSKLARRLVSYTITSPLRALLSNSLLVTFAVSIQYMTCVENGYMVPSRGSSAVIDVPFIHCSMMESPIFVSIPIVLTAFLLFLLSELLGRFAGYRFFQARHRRHGTGLFDSADHLRPVQLPMVPWFSLSLTTTAIQLLVSLKIFVGRLDIRHILNAVCKEQSDIVFDMRLHESWVDFFADGGDGFNSTYTVARMMAQPTLTVYVPPSLRDRLTIGTVGSVVKKFKSKPTTPVEDSPAVAGVASAVIHRRLAQPISSADDVRISPIKSDSITLPRAPVVVHGGDLAYPRPSSETYRARFQYPLEAAFPAGPGGPRPRMFLIPGNHDHYDGLDTFVRFVVGGTSIGGWKLPQKSSYFALQLQKNWWILAMDIGLTNDVDVFQFSTFSKIIDDSIGETDRVVVVTHRPQWIMDMVHGEITGELYLQLLDRIGPSRLAMRLAGDVHHYQRYSGGPAVAQLVTSGGGGAFLHPTHLPMPEDVNEYFAEVARVRATTGEVYDSDDENDVMSPDSPMSAPTSPRRSKGRVGGATAASSAPGYTRVASFPSEETSRKLAWMNLIGFRSKNWGADIIFGSIYVLMSISVLPMCGAGKVVDAFRRSLVEGMLGLVTQLVIPNLRQVYLGSTVSLVAQVAFLYVCFKGAHCRRSNQVQRFLIAVTHWAVHVVSSMLVFAVLEVAIEFLAQASGGRESVVADGFRVPGIVASVDASLFGSPVVEPALEWLIRFVDFPSSLIRNRQPICMHNGGDREMLFRYIWRVLPFFWVLATPVAGQVMGTYLFVNVNYLGLHLNEAFSSLRIKDYKHFLRMFIDPTTEDLHIYVVGIEKVPKHFEEDPAWDPKLFGTEPLPPSSKWVNPSRWRSRDSVNPVLVDYFVLPKIGVTAKPVVTRTRTTGW